MIDWLPVCLVWNKFLILENEEYSPVFLVLCLSCQFYSKGSKEEVFADTLAIDVSAPESV